MLGVLADGMDCEDSESGSELAPNEYDEDESPQRNHRVDVLEAEVDDAFSRKRPSNDKASVSPLGAAQVEPFGSPMVRPGEPARKNRRQVTISNINLSITASHVFCEIWEAMPDGKQYEYPWGLCVIPRPTFAQRKGFAGHAQIDHLTGGLLESLDENGECSANQKVVTFHSRMPWRSLLTQNHIWYMLSEGCNLYSLLLNQSPVRVISNLLVFENRLKASQLCALNGWKAKQLPVLTLFLGLRFRELDEIKQSLGYLRPDQEMEACQMIMGFILSGYSCASLQLPFSPSPPGVETIAGERSETPPGRAPVSGSSSSSHLPADRSFVSRLLEMSMQFVTKLIQTRVMQIQGSEGACRALTYLQPKHAASEPKPAARMVHELAQLTVHMQSLRELQQQLIVSFGDDKAYDSGITINCPAQAEARPLDAKTGYAALDSAIQVASKLQTGALQVNAEKVSSMRSIENAEAIVRAALISGRVSSALNWFHEVAAEDGSVGFAVFEEFRVTAGRLAYQLTCNQQVDFLFIAMNMLRNVGTNVNKVFKALAFHTSKRLVRRRLLGHLKHMKRLTKEEQALISLVNLLEKLYTNPCYTTEFNRMTTDLVTGQYPQRAHSDKMPPFYMWPAGGRKMLLVGLSCDGAIGGHINVDMSTTDLTFEQQTSLRELPVFQRMPLEMHDIWAGYQTPVMAAMLEMPADARRSWNNLPCGDIEDLDAQPILGLSNFHKCSNLEHDPETAAIADMREVEAANNVDAADTWNTTSQLDDRRTCRQCRLDGLRDELDFDEPRKGITKDAFVDSLGLGKTTRNAIQWGTCM
jgi:hypothetical protein